ncbi:hypothetical protein BSKO_03244 [Bryopsis sp. KO-2023]|nr:hypothetical protein BSKO_03244 [Bryopsis sp. KO-2023]
MFRELMSGISSLLAGESDEHDSGVAEPSLPPSSLHIEGLPDEVLLQILFRLDKESMASMRLVCSSWYKHSGLVVKTLSPKVLKKGIVRGRNNSFASLKSLDLSKTTGVTDQKLGLLSELKTLQHLKLKRCRNVFDMGLGNLAKMDKLESLNLARCLNISDEGIALLVAGATNLKTLNIKFCYKITNTGIAALAGLNSLTSLNCSHCRHVSDIGLHGLTGLKNLQTLKISDCDQITDHGMEILSGMSSLTALHASIERTLQQHQTDASLRILGGCLVNLVTLKYTFGEGVSIDGVREITGLTRIRELRLGRVCIPMDELFSILGQVTSLELLRLDGCGDIFEGSMNGLTNLTNLRMLSLGAKADGSKMCDSGLGMLSSLDKLEELILARFVCFHGMALKSLTKLKKLDLVGCHSVQHEAIAGLASLKDLKCLCFSYNQHITDDAILSFAAMGALESLTLCECINVTGSTLGALSGLTGLKKLCLSFCGKLCDGGMRQISLVPSLTELNVAMCSHITDQGALALGPGMKNLRHLNIAGCDLVTHFAQKKLQEVLPQLAIERKSLHPTLIHMLGNDVLGD